MEPIKKIAIGFGAGILLILGLYFFVYLPDVKKAYDEGLSQCEKDTDTLYLPGEPIIEYRDTSFAIKTPTEIEKKDSSNIAIFSSIDTSVVSGKDTISIQITNSQELNLIELFKNGKEKVKGNLAEWFMKIRHKDYAQTPDTVKIFTPKYIPKVEMETNWLLTGIAYVAGLASAIFIFITAAGK